MPSTPSDTLQDAARAVHDVGLAAWLGGATFGKFALNPSVAAAGDPRERGKVVNAAWNGYNVVNALGLGTAALVHVAARTTALKPENLSGRERTLITVQDGFMGASVLTGVLNGVQGARLARQAPEGAVPVETGTKPTADTPPAAAKIQKSLETLGNVNILSGIGLIATNALFDRAAFSRPPAKRLGVGGGVGGGSPARLLATVGGALAANALAGQLSKGQSKKKLPSESFLPSALFGGGSAGKAKTKAKKKGTKTALKVGRKPAKQGAKVALKVGGNNPQKTAKVGAKAAKTGVKAKT